MSENLDLEQMAQENKHLAELNAHNFMSRQIRTLADENTHLKQQYNTSIDLLGKSVEEKLRERVENAKELKKIALQEQDVDRQFMLDEVIISAIHAMMSY